MHLPFLFGNFDKSLVILDPAPVVSILYGVCCEYISFFVLSRLSSYFSNYVVEMFLMGWIILMP